MKVGIIAFNNIKVCPYINPYAELLRKRDIEFDLIYANRSGDKEEYLETTYPIKWNRHTSKLINFISFSLSVRKILKKNKYDFLVILTTIPAILLFDLLLLRYSNKYVIDVRDYTYENNPIYYMVEKMVINSARIRVISSPGFRNFLPVQDYLMCHNIPPNYKDDKYMFNPAFNRKIRIGYVGMIAYKEQCKQLIDLIEKDDRFIFWFYGIEASENIIIDYIEEKNNDRIVYKGAYKPAEKLSVIENIDLLFNAYGNGNNLLDYALSNKLYDSFYTKKPLLTSSNTAMSREAGQYSFDIDYSNSNILDELFIWYQSINKKSFEEYSFNYLKKVYEEQQIFGEKLAGSIKNGED